jgi:hypothetical protein
MIGGSVFHAAFIEKIDPLVFLLLYSSFIS